MELRWNIEYYYTKEDHKDKDSAEIVNSIKVLQFKDIDDVWKNVPLFEDLKKKEELELNKKRTPK